MKIWFLLLILSLKAYSASLFDCVEVMSFPTMQSGAMRYDWVEAEAGKAKVSVHFLINANRQAKQIKISTLSYQLGLQRWIESYLTKTSFRAKCVGAQIDVIYTIIVRRPPYKYNLPATTMGPGENILLEFTELTGSGPFLTNRPTVKP
jgi:hypothetical protein